MSNNSKAYKGILIGLGFLILLAGIWAGYKVSNDQNPEPSELKAQFLKGGEFTLNIQNTSFSLSSLKGEIVVLYFGYTHCPDVCPTGLAVMRDAFTKLGDDITKTRGVFISLDPERDTPERLSEYVGFFHPNIKGYSGSHLELAQLVKNYGVYYRKVVMEDSALGYAVDHTANFFIIDTDGELAYVLDHAVSSETLADTIRALE